MPFLRWLLIAVIVSLVGSFLCAGPVPTGKPSTYPDWWFERDVIPRLPAAANKPNPVWPGDYPPADDYAAANLGQLKHIAGKAASEMAARLPAPGAGSEIDGLVSKWQSSPASGVIRDDFATLNQGQLKAVAKPFYDRLGALAYVGAPLAAGLSYPWSFATTDDDAYAMANLGQLKYLFSFNPANVPAPTSLIGIAWPPEGAVIPASTVDIVGTWNSTTPLRTLMLNGQPVYIAGNNNWYARAVPLVNGLNVLTFVATDINGVVTTFTRTITASYASNMVPSVTLTADVVAGSAPLAVTFTASLNVSGTIESVAYYFLSRNQSELQAATLSPQSFVYQESGIYYPTVTIRLTDGSNYSSGGLTTSLNERLAIKVGLSENTPLAVWSAFKVALSGQDVEQAVNYMSPHRADSYREILGLLGPDGLAAISSDLADLTMVVDFGEVAQYSTEVSTSKGVVSFPVNFIKEGDFWQIDEF